MSEDDSRRIEGKSAPPADLRPGCDRRSDIDVFRGLRSRASHYEGPSWSSSRPPCAQLADSSPVALTTPLMAQVARRDANTDLYVSNDATESLRLTVRIDEGVAYDATVPGAGDCMHPPIYRSSYRLPAGSARVQVTASNGRTKSRTFRAGPHRWLTVAVQDDFPLGLDVWRQRPSFG